ncbi:hypothetical protein ACJMK2_042859 [Sinanodonta woodiana]|uniref:Uncharacterized protein n=1 Tax=Sinanodonta woodiana TaxID=1069815 RepID=A0ABD3VV42_SINWO
MTMVMTRSLKLKLLKSKPKIVKPPQSTKDDKNIIKIANLTERNKTLRRQLNESINNNSTITDTVNQLQQRNSIIDRELVDLREQLKDVTQSRDQTRKALNELREKLTLEQKSHSALKLEYDNLTRNYKSDIEKLDNINVNQPVSEKQHRKKKNHAKNLLDELDKQRGEEVLEDMRLNELWNQSMQKLGR